MLSPDKITVGRIGVAYGLTSKEMWQLVDAIGAVFNHTSLPRFYFPGLPVGKRYSHNEAYNHAKIHVESERFERFLLPEFWGKIDILYGFDKDDSAINYVEMTEGIENDSMGLDFDTLKGLVTHFVSYILLESAIVDKNNSVTYLHNCGYSLKKEIKGINHSLINSIVSKADCKNETRIGNEICTQHIQKWREILCTLKNKTDIHVANLAIAKFQGMAHIEAYDTIYNERKTNVSNKSKIEHVSKAKTRVENIAKLHFLPMPEWEISKS